MRDQVAVHLVVGQPVQGDPGEARAGTETTSNLVNPGVVESHPGGLVAAKVAGLDVLPEVVGLEVLAGLSGVKRPLALLSKPPQLESADEDGASGRAEVVLVLAEPEHNGAEAEQDGGQEPGQPEADVLLDVHHGDLTSQGANVDEHVEVQEDAGDGDSGIANDALASLLVDNDTKLGSPVLLSDQGRDVRLESASAETKSDDTQDEGGNSLASVEHDWQSGDDKQDVADDGEANGEENGVEASEVLIGNDGTHDGSGVGPESIEGADTSGSLLAHTQSTGLTLGARVGTSARALRARTLDEVGV